MSAGILRPSTLAGNGYAIGGRINGNSDGGGNNEELADAFAVSATQGLASEMHEWMWPGVTPTEEALAPADSQFIAHAQSARQQRPAASISKVW